MAGKIVNNSISRILFVIFDNYNTERPGLQILSTIAREEGFERKGLILNNIPLEEALQNALAFRPVIVAYTDMSFEKFNLQAFNCLLKERGLRFVSIFGGHHYTFNPEEIYHDDNIDVVCRGEGEVAFRQSNSRREELSGPDQAKTENPPEGVIRITDRRFVIIPVVGWTGL